MSVNGLVTGVFLAILLAALILYAVVWVLYGISHMKLLKLVGYSYPWMAWVPFLRIYALADCLPEEEADILGLKIPIDLFRFWWALSIFVTAIPAVGTLLNIILRIICLGHCYTVIYSVTDHKYQQEVATLGYLSGGFPIIAVFKYLFKKTY